MSGVGYFAERKRLQNRNEQQITVIKFHETKFQNQLKSSFMKIIDWSVTIKNKTYC